MTTRFQRVGALLAAGVLVLSACSGAKKTGDGEVSAGTETTTDVANDQSPGESIAGGPTDTAPGAVGAGGTTGATTAGGKPAAGTSSGSGGAGGGTSGGGGPAVAPSTLFTPAENNIGISAKQIHLCAHAALTYGPAFNTDADDLPVYFTAINEEQGGIHGRKVTISYHNDNYDPTTAVQAAEACKAENPFMMLGGIGFDQIPSVRNWAEQNHMLYAYHTATKNGAAGKKYSLTPLPSVEKMGEMFGEHAVTRHRTKRIGVVQRDSANWAPGIAGFNTIAKKHGLNIVHDAKVPASKANYTQEILDMKGKNAQVVFIWLNALESTEFISQAKAQQYNPIFMVFPFNLTSQTLDADALNPPLEGVAMFAAYSYQDYSGPFAPYADDMKEFERQYAKYDPGADLEGFAGDLLFLNWTAMKALAQQLRDCGPQCTRNRMVDVIANYRKVPTSSACMVDFTRNLGYRLGGHTVNFMQTYRAPSGKVNWRHTNACVEHLPGMP